MPDRVQVVMLKVPVLLWVHVIVPAGVDAVPGEVSVTVAVHVDGWLTFTEVGTH